MAVAPEVIRGYLVLQVEEASGKTQRDQFSWDGTGAFEAFVKVEVRGGPRNVKAQTRKSPLIGETITWREELRLELLEGSTELRFMLCREKIQGNKRGTSVIAACGIYVNDILEAVPIDKYFELFKPNAGGEGGFVRISMDFVKDLTQVDSKRDASSVLQPNLAFPQVATSSRDAAGRLQGVVPADSVDAVAQRVAAMGKEGAGKAPQKKHGGKGLAIILPALIIGAAAAAVGILLKKR